MTRLILVRHGQSEANQKRIFSGQRDYPLTEAGLLQAELAADYLEKNEKIDLIYSSDLQRAYNTALATAKRFELDVIKDSSLREFDVGEWAGKSREQIAAEYPEVWNTEGSLRRYPGGEYTPDAFERSVNAIKKIAERHDGKCVMIAAHAGVIRSFAAFSNSISKYELSKMPDCHNASINVFEYHDGVSIPVRYDITEHLESEITINSDKNII